MWEKIMIFKKKCLKRQLKLLNDWKKAYLVPEKLDRLDKKKDKKKKKGKKKN